MRYEKTIVVAPESLEKINKYLDEEPECEGNCLSEDETIIETAVFEDGYEMDIKCCGVKYEEGGCNTSWTEAVLFHNGSEIACSDVGDDFEGDWELKDNDGNTYIVHVVCEC